MFVENLLETMLDGGWASRRFLGAHCTPTENNKTSIDSLCITTLSAIYQGEGDLCGWEENVYVRWHGHA